MGTLSSDDENLEINLFQEPEGYYKPEAASTEELYHRKIEGSDGKTVRVHLLGRHPLWGHMLWNASKVMAEYLDENAASLVHGKYLLELGAGGALPSIIAALNKPAKVVATDYPDADLMENINYNFQLNVPQLLEDRTVIVMGHLWGKECHKVVDAINTDDTSHKFDVIILSDVIFNHHSHRELLETCKCCLRNDGEGKVLVTFSHHKTHKAAEDLNFFTMAQEEPFNFKVQKLFSRRMKAMFEEDFGPEEVRATVHFYTLENQ